MSKLKLSESAVRVVADDTRATIRDFDEALLTSLRLTAHTIEGLLDASVPALQSQRLYGTFNNGMSKLIDGRQDIVSAISQLQVIHRRSTQAEVDVGCPTPWYPMGMANPEANEASEAKTEFASA